MVAASIRKTTMMIKTQAWPADNTALLTQSQKKSSRAIIQLKILWTSRNKLQL